MGGRLVIALVRHPPPHVAAGICYGSTDLGLADPASVASLAVRLRALPGTLWTSPLRRCRSVADAVGPNLVEARLRELDFGAWEGLAWSDIPRAALDAWAADPLKCGAAGRRARGGARDTCDRVLR